MMDWGLTTVILAVAFLAGHLALDFRTLAFKLRRPHTKAEDFDGPAPMECERCHARERGERELRHEAIWTVAAIAVLTSHIILDFVQRGG